MSLIIVVASFNILGSLTMTVIEKKRDIGILKALGASDKTITRIFMFEGLVVGFVIAYFFLKSKKTVSIEEANKLNEQINSLKVDSGKLAERIKLFEEDKANLQIDLKNEREKSF